jgi:CMP-N-acetylneuraminic acid synthetase
MKITQNTRPEGTVALIIGRGGSSLKGKNLMTILGSSSCAWVAASAVRSESIDSYYVSSDSDEILSECEPFGFQRIKRPANLSTSTAKGCDVIDHALEIIEQREGHRYKYLVLLHANAPTVQPSEIKLAISLLEGDPLASAAVPAYVEQDRHPFRAKEWKSDGTLRSFFSGAEVSSNRQELPKAVFLAHTFWVIALDNGLTPAGGEAPWHCLGGRVLGFEVETRSDIHSMEDVRAAEEWLQHNSIDSPQLLLR